MLTAAGWGIRASCDWKYSEFAEQEVRETGGTTAKKGRNRQDGAGRGESIRASSLINIALC